MNRNIISGLRYRCKPRLAYYTVLALFAFILTATMTMTSCGNDNSDSNNESYQSQLAGTQWQLSEVLYNNVWQYYPDLLEIPYLRFGKDNSFEIKLSNYDGYSWTTTVKGTYSIADGTVNFVDNMRIGIAFFIRITSIIDNVFEGVLTIYGDEQHTYAPDGNTEYVTRDVRNYTIRLKRI